MAALDMNRVAGTARVAAGRRRAGEHGRSYRPAARWLAALLALVAARPAAAQVVVGHVLAEATREPVAGADVQLVSASGQMEASATSDSTGDFQMRARLPGTYTLRIAHIAYVDYESRPIEVGRGVTVEFEIRLGTNVIPLQPLVVTARTRDRRLSEFYDRVEHQAFGKFITRDQIDASPAFEVTDLLRMTPGLRVVPIGSTSRSLVLMRGTTGQCLPEVYLDGVRIEQSADFPIDDLLVPDFLEGVEVYTSGSVAPAEYHSGNCGVLLFWSRSFREGGRPFSMKRLLAGLAAAGLIILIAR